MDEIPVLWIAGPVSGLLVQPIIGYMSDKTWNRLGRRKPYFLVGAILASLALLVMPNSPVLWFAAGMLWIMDASINITMEQMCIRDRYRQFSDRCHLAAPRGHQCDRQHLAAPTHRRR